MSDIFAPAHLVNPDNTSNETAQKLLEENHYLIQTIAGLQSGGHGSESMEYLRTLHRNLVFLMDMAEMGVPPLPEDPYNQVPTASYANDQMMAVGNMDNAQMSQMQDTYEQDERIVDSQTNMPMTQYGECAQTEDQMQFDSNEIIPSFSVDEPMYDQESFQASMDSSNEVSK
ncbi:hypothetical protein GJ496_006877 [Pomphorhynchus laevis]|nr:hypothetical protein GJ496_006877 [Pomphorhynchus laevis]